jgi:hypothetical protein
MERLTRAGANAYSARHPFPLCSPIYPSSFKVSLLQYFQRLVSQHSCPLNMEPICTSPDSPKNGFWSLDCCKLNLRTSAAEGKCSHSSSHYSPYSEFPAEKKPVHSDILKLPTELHLKILSYLNTTASVCLGITCHYFYDLHLSVHGKIYLNFFDTPRLPSLLKEWMAPEYTFYHKTLRFVHHNRVEEMRNEERAYLEGYFEKMKIGPHKRRKELVERLMNDWESDFGVRP